MGRGKVVLTGGGTAGHVTSNLALIPRFLSEGYELYYIGSYDGIEKRLIEAEGIPYYGVDTGKLRRYFDIRNFTDPIHVLRGEEEAKRHLKEIRPDILFSKGGFVAVPVVWAAHRLQIPVVSHESDMTPGLANRLTLGCAEKICCNFPETAEHLPKGKAVLTGAPIREKLLTGSREAGLRMTGFSGMKPVLMVIGGSLGSVAINNAVRKILPKLSEQFDIIHLCGKGNLDPNLRGTSSYVQYEYISDGLEHLYAACDLAISRAGANVICELLALKKANILIPLPKGASRGDQILNAASFEKQGFSYVLPQEEVEADTGRLFEAVEQVFREREKYVHAMRMSKQGNGLEAVFNVIVEVMEHEYLMRTGKTLPKTPS